MTHCLLCKSKKVKNIQRIKTKSILDLYKKELNIDVTTEFSPLQSIDSLKCSDCGLLFFEPKVPGSEQFYEDLQQLESVYYSDSRPEFFEALKSIDPKDKVLEIGAGSASFAEKLNSKTYVGLEYNQEAIDKAKSKGILLLKESIENFAINNAEQFDVVCSFHVLEHVSNPYSYIESSLKTLKKGGKFICAVPCSDSFYSSNHNHVLNMPPHHITRWGTKTFQHICNSFNLEVQSLYVSEVVNARDYFEIKIRTLFFKFIFPNKQIIVNALFLKIFHRIFKKINRALGLYKWDNPKQYKGINMMMVAIKK
jgi:SAM-dependent methyltransferase